MGFINREGFVTFEEGIGVSLLTNAQFSGVPQRSIDIAFATLLGEEVQEVVAEKEDPYTAEELQAFTGKYDFAAAKQVWTVFVNAAGRLALDYPGETIYELAWPDEAGRWAFAAAPQVQIAFHHDEADGKNRETLLYQPISLVFRFHANSGWLQGRRLWYLPANRFLA